MLDQLSELYFVWEPNLPKPGYRIGVKCSSSLLSLALPSLLTHSSGYTPGGDSYHFPINFLFLLSLRPLFSLSSHSQLHNWLFLCHVWRNTKLYLPPPPPSPSSEALKSAVKRFFPSLLILPSLILLLLLLPPQHFPHVAVPPNLTSVFISPSSAGT